MTPEGELPRRAEAASALLQPLIIAWWVTTDARVRRQALCYDYATFVFLAWPIVVPIYLFQTRGAKAFLTLLYFAGLWLVSLLVSGAITVLRS